MLVPEIIHFYPEGNEVAFNNAVGPDAEVFRDRLLIIP